MVYGEYEIYATDEFKRNFKALARKNHQLRGRVLDVIDKLKKNPRIGKPLSHDLAGKWTIRVERIYRIVYEIDEENKRVILMTIKHRKKVY